MDEEHAALIRELVQDPHSELAWARFIREYESHIRLAALRAARAEQGKANWSEAGPLRELVEDITQEVFMRLISNKRRALAAFEGRHELSLRSYLGAITKNVVRDHFKSLRRQKRPSDRVHFRKADSEELMDIDQVLVSDEPGLDQAVLSAELVEHLEQSEGDNTRDQVLFRLYFVEGLSMREISEVDGLKMTERAVESGLRRIRDELKKRVNAEPSTRANPELNPEQRP